MRCCLCRVLQYPAERDTHGWLLLHDRRLSQNIKPLIWVECAVERPSRSRTDYLVKARSQYKERSAATNVEIIVPLPPDAISPVIKAGTGAAEYVPERSALVWRLKNFPGGKEFELRWAALQGVQLDYVGASKGC